MSTLDIIDSSIQAQNDRLRREGLGGSIIVTSGIQALEPEAVAAIMAAVVSFDEFTPSNDPYGEHDFGSVVIEGQTIFFKFDAYDRELRYGSPDPSHPAVTRRVMTVMLAEEY